MVFDLRGVVDVAKYISSIQYNPKDKSSDTLLGKYKCIVQLSPGTISFEFLHNTRNQKHFR